MRLHGMNLTAFFSFIAVTLFSAGSPAAERARVEATFDVVIANGRIVDGTGNPWFLGDLAIKNGRIVKIGKIDAKLGKRLIDAKGMVVSPGFIDLHTHTDMPALADGNTESAVRQGVTLDVIGESETVAPLKGDVLEEYKEASQATQRRRRRLDHARRLFPQTQPERRLDQHRLERLAAAGTPGRGWLRGPAGHGG